MITFLSLSSFLPLFLRCVLLPLLSVKPPQQSLFLLVDSIDEGCQVGEGEQRSSPGSPRTIAELLASHHEFLPPWLLLICSARRQNKAITKLFTGEQSGASHESAALLLVNWGHHCQTEGDRLITSVLILCEKTVWWMRQYLLLSVQLCVRVCSILVIILFQWDFKSTLGDKQNLRWFCFCPDRSATPDAKVSPTSQHAQRD